MLKVALLALLVGAVVWVLTWLGCGALDRWADRWTAETEREEN